MDIPDMLAKLNALESAQPCPACGHDGWQAQERLVSMPAVYGDRLHPLEGLPCLALICKVCGYVRFHSANFLEQR